MSEDQEFIDVAKPEQPSKQIGIMDMLQMELHRYMKQALEFKRKIETAKSAYKKKYYEKKLKKNNMEALKVLTAIQRVERQQKTREDKSDVELTNETPDQTDE